MNLERDEATEIVPGEHDFFRRFERLTIDRAIFEAQGDAHGDIDLRLVEKIEDLLVPVLGHWEESSTWFHQMDYYGDGVRSLTFRTETFPVAQIRALQDLLVGEHEPFVILCIVRGSVLDSAASSEDDEGFLALFAHKRLVTRDLAGALTS